MGGAENSPRGQRVLDGLAAVGAERRALIVAASNNKASGEMEVPANFNMRSYNMKPPRLTAIARGKLSTHVCPKSAASEPKSLSR